ncbi:protein kinase domain-containing protein [Ditylenchus destructor]|uniref:Protein kinase domain-containing protein n=1 Tax=Ditylenchus destructor TaxID=166010 RepID=A0AAD4R226_9BILA|nr:protein kinase domain-containing protein [Ditylenchus destructor]
MDPGTFNNSNIESEKMGPKSNVAGTVQTVRPYIKGRPFFTPKRPSSTKQSLGHPQFASLSEQEPPFRLRRLQSAPSRRSSMPPPVGEPLRESAIGRRESTPGFILENRPGKSEDTLRPAPITESDEEIPSELSIHKPSVNTEVKNDRSQNFETEKSASVHAEERIDLENPEKTQLPENSGAFLTENGVLGHSVNLETKDIGSLAGNRNESRVSTKEVVDGNELKVDEKRDSDSPKPGCSQEIASGKLTDNISEDKPRIMSSSKFKKLAQEEPPSMGGISVTPSIMSAVVNNANLQSSSASNKKKFRTIAKRMFLGPPHGPSGSLRLGGSQSRAAGVSLKEKFVVDPSKDYYYHWTAVLALAFTYNMMFVIYRCVFIDQAVSWIWIIVFAMCDVITDIIYLLDSFFCSRTGYLEQGLLVRDVRKVTRRYWRSPQRNWDIASCIPLDYIWELAFRSPKPVLRFNRLIRLERVQSFLNTTETRISVPNAFRVSCVVFYILILIHWNACVYFFVSNLIGLGSDAWVYGKNNTQSLPPGIEDSLTRRYVYSFYWSTLILTTIGEVPGPVNNIEFIFVNLDLMCGVLIFATIVGNVGSMIANMSAARSEFQTSVDSVKQYMKMRCVGKHLVARVLKWFDYLWANKQTLNDQQVLNVLPTKLQAEIAMHVHFETLRKVRIFQDCEAGLLAELVLKLQLQVFSPNDYVCRKGDIGREMYIVKRGRLQVVSDDGKKVFTNLQEGSVFGELSILNIAGSKIGNRRSASIRSVGYTDLFVLNKNDLWEALQEYPGAQKVLMIKAREILRKDNLMENDAPEETKTPEEIALDLRSSLERLQFRFAKLIAEHVNTENKLKNRLQYLEEQCRKYGLDEGFDEDDENNRINHKTNQTMRNRSSNRQSCSQPLPSTKSSYTSSSTQPLAGSTNSKYRGASQQQVPEESVSPPLVDRLGTCSITGKQSADSAADLFDSTFSHSQPSSHFQKDSNSCPEVISNDLPPHLLSESESDTETSSDENERSFEKLAAEYKIGNKEAFNERYEIVKNTPHEEWQLGDGQYSTVLLIMDKQVNEAKRTKPTNNTDPKVAELAKKSELYALKKVRKREVALCEVNTWRKIGAHRRIVQLYEVYSDNDDLLLVLELAGGGDLFDLMNFLSSQNPPKKLTMDQALFYLSEIVEALKHIHDMDAADPVDEDGVSYLFSGTSELMAPEMPGSLRRTLISFFGKEHLKTHGFPSHTKKVDIFSLGVLSIEMLTNRRIFRATKIDLEGNEVDKYEDEAKQADAIEHNIKTQVINKEVLKTMVKTHGLPDDENLHEFLEKCLQHDVNERPTIEGVENLSWLSNYRARVTQGVKPPFRVSSLVKINSTVVTRIASKGKTGIKYTLNPA